MVAMIRISNDIAKVFFWSSARAMTSAGAAGVADLGGYDPINLARLDSTLTTCTFFSPSHTTTCAMAHWNGSKIIMVLLMTLPLPFLYL